MSVCLLTWLFAEVLNSDYICFVVIDGLDRLKKENAGARDGIRFLEAEFRKGNRWVLKLPAWWLMELLFRGENSVSLLGYVEHKITFGRFHKDSVSHPSVGTYAARRSRVEVLKEINWNVRTSKPGKRCSTSTVASLCFLTYRLVEHYFSFEWSTFFLKFLGIYTRWWTVVVS